MPNNVLSRSQMTSETIIWKNRMETIGAGFEWNSIAIANNVSRVLQSKSYYSKIIYFLPLLGRGINSSLVPLVDKLNKGNSTNISSLTNTNFNQSSGVFGNGSGQMISTPLLGSELGASNNAGLGFLLRNLTGANNNVMGLFSTAGGGRIYGMDLGSVTARFWWGDGNTATSSGSAASLGHYYGQRISNTDRKLYFNGSQIATSSLGSLNMNGINDHTIAVLARAGDSSTQHLCGLAYLTNGELSVGEIQDLNRVLQEYLIGPTGR